MIRTIFILSLFLATAVLAQDKASEDEAVTETGEDSVESSTDDAADESLDDDILSGSQDHTQEDDDIFVPTDEISFQQSIPFPTDI